MKKNKGTTFAQNRKARHEYTIEETYEAGIVLRGTEVKSIRQGKVSMKECYAAFSNGEIFVYGMHITPYEQGNIFNTDPVRTRKLLLNRRELRKLDADTKEKGLTLIPLSLYEKNGLVKMSLALARGKKLYDKRTAIKERDAKKRIDRAIKEMRD